MSAPPDFFWTSATLVVGLCSFAFGRLLVEVVLGPVLEAFFDWALEVGDSLALGAHAAARWLRLRVGTTD